MSTSLRSEELAQWTPARPAIISEILIHGLSFLESTTPDKSKNDSTGYQKATANIMAAFTPTGDSRLKVSQQGKSQLDGSALLGAYFRSKIKGDNGQPIISLTEEQMVAVRGFVTPLASQGFTSQQYLDSFNGTPRDNHIAVLKQLIFQGISEAEQAAMFKEKYNKAVDLMLDSMLSIVDFMRTPFSVLESQANADTKKTSGIDLQWSTMLNGFEQTMQNLLKIKTGDKILAETDFENWGNDKALIQTCYGVENERNRAAKTIHELTAALAELKSKSDINATVLEKMVVALGYADKRPEDVLAQLEPYIRK